MDIAALDATPHADALVRRVRELELADHILDLEAYGFTVIPPEKTGVGQNFVERLRDALLTMYGRRHNDPIHDYRTAEAPATGLDWWLLEEDDVLVEAVLNPVALTLARWLCGESALLSSTMSIIKAPSPPGQQVHYDLHHDSPGVPPPLPQYAQLCNTTWLLTDYAAGEDGPTVFVPGSHRFGRLPMSDEAQLLAEGATVHPVPLIAKAGSLVVWHGNTWHGSLPRSSPGLRLTLVLIWCRQYIQPMHSWVDISPELVSRFPELRRVLGIDKGYPFKESYVRHEGDVNLMAISADQFA